VVVEVVVMRAALCSLVVLFLAAPAFAQVAPHPCSRILVEGRVDVETTTGTLRGTLFCLSIDEVMLLQEGTLVRTPLSAVKRIATPADPVRCFGSLEVTPWSGRHSTHCRPIPRRSTREAGVPPLSGGASRS